MKSISKSKLKSRMLEYFREVEKTGEEINVTDHGQPTLRVIPYADQNQVNELFAQHRGKVVYHADILEPETDEWMEV
ncbi:MAG TPA: type II toxin-antitoxin system prevent-host-death family antitoxin [Verrucomicrobiales bacterium]|jgi:prevent-host-death family protein|nr:type II toxin-antitoxin system prevent-host-death family antitoxin [Verrucomicrobiales bacterium]HIL70524.1 type II toxin-antitoxin system prevent-host-death family antitoxin [Verrucomicrobiota bacterium]